MGTSLDILKKVWGFDQFRPMQKDIVDAVLKGDDVLALLPTGGGKSICFQVPALMKEGVCIVITPLIALMKDQVEQLKGRGVKAEAIYGGLGKREIDVILDNCIYGGIKFLYLSPERLHTELFIERVKKMQVSIIVVDEAHCISQWGYDFRPLYLEIAQFRELVPDTNVIALTATATEQVKKDIVEKLSFKNDIIFQASFARGNLSYSVRKVEDKEAKLLEILNNVKGSAVVYVNTRKATKEVAQLLVKNKISADYYHAGLPFEQRGTKQDNWIKNRTRVIVATNAFGMGIDKPDVRLVIHIDLPQSLEAYYQEAGRAGRDGKKAYAVALFYQKDPVDMMRRLKLQFPNLELIKRVYQCLANYYKVAVGSATEESYDFDLTSFAEVYDLDALSTYYAINKLEQEGVVQLNENFHHPSKLMFAIDNKELYEFLVANGDFDHFVKSVLRLYGGELFSNFINISETRLVKLAGKPVDQVIGMLNTLHQLNILHYDQQKDKPQFSFVTQRYDVASLPIDVKRLDERKKIVDKKMKAVNDYSTNVEQCRTQQLLFYFGELYEKRCGVCDNCIEDKKRFNDDDNFRQLRSRIISAIEDESIEVNEIVIKVNHTNKKEVISVLRKMIDFGEVEYDELGRLSLR